MKELIEVDKAQIALKFLAKLEISADNWKDVCSLSTSINCFVNQNNFVLLGISKKS